MGSVDPKVPAINVSINQIQKYSLFTAVRREQLKSSIFKTSLPFRDFTIRMFGCTRSVGFIKLLTKKCCASSRRKRHNFWFVLLSGEIELGLNSNVKEDFWADGL